MNSWLPDLVLNPGNWNEYLELIYGYFVQDFVSTKPKFGDKRVGLKSYPLRREKEATFWHFIEESEDSSRTPSEEERIPNFRCCERIRWPKPVMEQYADSHDSQHDNGKIRWWKSTRRSKTRTQQRFVLSLADFSYVVIVDDRGDYVLPWTQFPVEKEHRRRKLEKEYNEYWAQKARDTV